MRSEIKVGDWYNIIKYKDDGFEDSYVYHNCEIVDINSGGEVKIMRDFNGGRDWVGYFLPEELEFN
jgi:hypothetical protein